MNGKHNPTKGFTSEEVLNYFILQSRNKYGDKFDYSLIDRIKTKKCPVKIICNLHGVFDTSFNNHLAAGTGCSKCGDLLWAQKKTSTLFQFNKKLDAKYPDRNWKVVSEYTHNKTPVIVEDIDGLLHTMMPNIMLNSSSTPSVRTALNKELYCITRFNKKHNNLYTYENFIYCGTKKKSTVTCRIHGNFNVTPNDHNNGRGCLQCNEDAKKVRLLSNTEDFIKKCIERFGDDIKIFNKVDYTGARNPILIYCDECQDYYSTLPNSYYSGYRCVTCARKRSAYSRTDYINIANGRDGIVYIIKCKNETEEFYKIGMTIQSVKTRFKSSNTMPYDYEIIYEWSCDPGCVWDTERDLHKEYKPYQQTPLILFAGHTECYNTSLPVQKIIDELS